MTEKVIMKYESLDLEQSYGLMPLRDRIPQNLERVREKGVRTYHEFSSGKNGRPTCFVEITGEREDLEKALKEYISRAGTPSYFIGGSNLSVARGALPENFSLRRMFPWIVPRVTAMKVYREFTEPSGF